MKIGTVDLGNKLFVAPMAEVSDAAFRKMCKKNGAGITFTQMVSADGVVKNNFETLRLLSFSKSEKPIGVQILGKDPGIVAEAVKEINNFKPDLIDINCGCPIDKVTSIGMGASIINNPKLLSSLVSKMALAADGTPVSAKLRIGFDDDNVNIIDNAKIVEDAGASLIIIHARTAKDKYDTDPDWNWIKKVKQSVSIPVVGNGSCFEPQDAFDMLSQTGCDSVMIARGALGNPFFFSRFNSIMENGSDTGEPAVDLIQENLIEHLDLLCAEFGEFKALTPAKKHAAWYFRSRPGIISFVENTFQAKTIEQIKERINKHVENLNKGIFENKDSDLIDSKFKDKVLFWLSNKVKTAAENKY